MATKTYPGHAYAYSGGGYNDFWAGRAAYDAKADGNNSWWATNPLMSSAGASAIAFSATTVAGPTSGIEVALTGSYGGPMEFISPPLAAAVTISGTITFNVWARESAMTANCGVQVIVEKVDGSDLSLATVINSEQGSEVGTSDSARNWTGTPTSTAFKKGDRIRVRILANDAGGTMASGQSMTITIRGGTPDSTGDTWVQFNETITFQETDPSGTTLYIDRYGALEFVENSSISTLYQAATANGPTSVQFGTGGSPVEFLSPSIQAVTLSGLVKLMLSFEGGTRNTYYPGGKVLLYTTDSAGASPVLWSTGILRGDVPYPHVLTANAYSWTVPSIAYLAGDDRALSDGQRLKAVVYATDPSWRAMASGGTWSFTAHKDSTYRASFQFSNTLVAAARVPRHGFAHLNDPAVFARAWRRRPWWQRPSGLVVPT